MVDGLRPVAAACASMRSMRVDTCMTAPISEINPTCKPDNIPNEAAQVRVYCPDMSDLDGFRARLKQAMNDAGVNPTALARAAGTDSETPRKMLAGTIRNPRLDHAAAYAGALGVSLDWIVSGHEFSALADRLAALPPEKRAAVEAMIAALEAG